MTGNARAGSRSAFIVLTTAGNRTRRDPTEGWEAPRDENRWRETRERTLSLANLSTKRQRIAALARAKRGVALSTLHHVIDLEWMKEAYRLTRKDGAPGIDGVTAADYATNLEANLSDLLDRIKSGRYQAPPVRRAYIPKADGSRRPLGLPTSDHRHRGLLRSGRNWPCRRCSAQKRNELPPSDVEHCFPLRDPPETGCASLRQSGLPRVSHLVASSRGRHGTGRIASFMPDSLPVSAVKIPGSSLRRARLHEIKHDGFRLIARRARAQVRLLTGT